MMVGEREGARAAHAYAGETVQEVLVLVLRTNVRKRVC